jgi:hypothetical protein
MTDTPVITGLTLAAVVFGVIGIALILAGLRALWRVRIWGFTSRLLLGLLLLATGSLAAVVAAGIQGYQMLTREEHVARISINPTAHQRFDARFQFARAKSQTFQLAGDEFYVDARILKWTPYANLIGLHTLWELDRVAGRYRAVEQEKTEPRTVFPLGPPQMVNLFELRRRFTAFAPLFDAEYGSASFVPAAEAVELDLFVSTTGLLLRPAR